MECRRFRWLSIADFSAVSSALDNLRTPRVASESFPFNSARESVSGEQLKWR
jgi:hypothetical protein